MSTIFLTGVTGVLGCEVLREISISKRHKLLVLVRATSFFHAQTRIQDLSIKLGIVESDLSEIIEVFPGDLESPNFGLDLNSYNYILDKTDYVIHSAAELSLKLSVDEARQKIVLPIHNLLNFVSRSKNLKRFIDVSTVGVGGLDYQSVPELRLNTLNFRNGYEQAKFDTESIVLDSFRPLVPVTIVRPSMIIGRVKDGWSLKPQIFSSICRLLSGQLTAGIVPDIGGFHLDTIPTDTVAKTLIELCSESLPADMPEILHLVSGEKMRISFYELYLLISDNIQIDDPIKFTSISEFEVMLPLVQKGFSEKERRKLAFIPSFLSYFSSDQIFENQKTINSLSNFDINIPNPSVYVSSTIRHIFSNENKQGKRLLRRVVRSEAEK